MSGGLCWPMLFRMVGHEKVLDNWVGNQNHVILHVLMPHSTLSK